MKKSSCNFFDYKKSEIFMGYDSSNWIITLFFPKISKLLSILWSIFWNSWYVIRIFIHRKTKSNIIYNIGFEFLLACWYEVLKTIIQAFDRNWEVVFISWEISKKFWVRTRFWILLFENSYLSKFSQIYNLY